MRFFGLARTLLTAVRWTDGKNVQPNTDLAGNVGVSVTYIDPVTGLPVSVPFVTPPDPFVGSPSPIHAGVDYRDNAGVLVASRNETDDNSIAEGNGQAAGIALPYAHSGSSGAWLRQVLADQSFLAQDPITTPPLAAFRPGNWSVFNSPGAGVNASVTRAGVPGRRHVITGLQFTLAEGTAEPVIVNATLTDGATTYVSLVLGGSGASDGPLILTGLSIVLPVGLPAIVSLPFGVFATSQAAVSMQGFTI